MADKPEAPKTDHFAEIAFLLICIYFLWAVYQRLADYFKYWSLDSVWQKIVAFFFHHLLPILELVAGGLAILSIFGIAYSFKKLSKIQIEEKAVFSPPVKSESKASDAQPQPEKNDKWERIVKHANSVNPSDWKLAIMEADIMLDDLLKSCGYHGDSLGERLRGVEPSDFLTLEAAWDAHKVRNQIAHQGADFDLNEREVRRVTALYESVFKEFKII